MAVIVVFAAASVVLLLLDCWTALPEMRNSKSLSFYFPNRPSIESPQWYARALKYRVGCIERDDEQPFLCRVTDCNDNNSQQSYTKAGYYQRRLPRGNVMVAPAMRNSGEECLLSHTFQFIFVHNLKAGGMSIKRWLYRSLCQSPQAGRPCGKTLVPASCEQALTQHPDYMVWSTVRNPYDRFRSAVAMAQHFGAHNASLVEYATTFRQSRESLTNLRLSHFLPQSSFLLDHEHCPVFDWLLRLDDTFPTQLEQLAQVLGLPLSVEGAYHKSQSTNFASRQPAQSTALAMTGVAREAIAQEYANDFTYFGYSK